MALENYTRTQKIAITVLIVVIAAMFTVTGAMLSLPGLSGQRGHVTEVGSINGEALRRVDFDRTRQGLWVVRGLDAAGAAKSDVKPIYARVPALSPLPQGGVPAVPQAYAGVEILGEISLLMLWPQFQDTQVWCHLELVKRARQANIVEPTNALVDASVLALFNANASELDKTTARQLEAAYRDRYGHELKEVRPVIRECLMVRAYVDSLLAGERARLADIAAIDAGNHEEIKAEYLRLSPNVFLDQARKEVLEENFRTRSRRLASGLAGGTPPSGPDLMEEVYDRVRHQHLQHEATFQFDLVRADFDEMARNIEIEESRARLYYEALKDELYKAGEDDKKKIDDRLKAWENRVSQTWEKEFPGKPKPATSEEWAKARDEQKPKLLDYKEFAEVRVELERDLRKDFAAMLAQAAMASLKSECEQEKDKRQTRLAAEAGVKQQAKANLEDLKRMRNDLRMRFDSMVSIISARFGDVQKRAGEAAATDETQLTNLASDLLRVIEEIGAENLRTLESTAARSTHDLDRSLKENQANLETLRDDPEAKGDDGEPLKPEVKALKIEREQLKIRGIEEQIKLRDEQMKQIAKFITDMRARLSDYALRAGAARHGDGALRKDAIERLSVEGRLELARFVRNSRDEIVPQTAIDDLDGLIQLAQVEVDAFNEQMRKDAANLSSLNLAGLAGDRKLKLESSPEGMTWRDILASPRYSFLEHVNGAQAFLENPQSSKGVISDLMAMPGQGIYLMRLGNKQPKYPLGAVETRERVIKLASMRRAREICVRELKRIRDEIIKDGWDAAVARAGEKYPTLEVHKTDFFTDNVDLPGVYSNSDYDVAKFSTSPSAPNPDNPFMERIKRMKAADGVTEIIPEKRNPDPLDRPDDEIWNYLLARVIDRRYVERRIAEESLKKDEGKYNLGEVWRNRRLASSDLVRNLMEPAQLLAGVKVERYPFERESERAKKEEEAKKGKPAP